jgi:hypothetical protein
MSSNFMRNYADGERDQVEMFVGVEVEKSPAYGKRTLFVVGLQDAKEVIRMATEEGCEHVYFGANMSFSLGNKDYDGWTGWERMIAEVMDAGFLATLDLEPGQLNGLLDGGLTDNHRFIPMISVKMPYIKLLNYNTTIKIDDIGFDETNPGVWCWQLNELLDRKRFTSWDEYKNDRPL